MVDASNRGGGQPACRSGARHLFIVRGRQVACREGLEVLILGTRRRSDGLPIREVLAETGRWRATRHSVGKRESAVPAADCSMSWCVSSASDALLGDEGGRPVFWGYPAHFGEPRAWASRFCPGLILCRFPTTSTR